MTADGTAAPEGAAPLGRAVALALALAAADPSLFARSPGLALVTAVPALGAAWWAGPVLVRRPVAHSARLASRLSLHRNTVFASGAVLLTAATSPPVWVVACVTALLLGYLLLVDALAAGPAGQRQWRSRTVVGSAYAASGLVLAAGFAPLGGTVWGPALAALAVAAAATVAGLALWSRGGRRRRDV